jgi:hypothetical protein
MIQCLLSALVIDNVFTDRRSIKTNRGLIKMAANNVISVSFSGKIFENGALLPQIQKTIARTTVYGSSLIASKTPVRTGMLQDGWTPLVTSIFNNVPYGIFIEDGTRRIQARNMVKNSLPDIEEYWLDLLSKAMD